MTILLRTASLAALALAFDAGYARAQDEVARLGEAVDSDIQEEARQATVIVTGSAMRGTPEDAALPVNVYSAQELELQGNPTVLDFAKSLPQAGPTFGEANFFGGGPNIGAVQINLRSLGADKTLTLLNGRRTSQNVSYMPGLAIDRIEVLKDGAAVIYGADAVGGVVNFIARDQFTGVEGRGSYKYVDGSDGDFELGFVAGIGEGNVNFMVSAEWEHRSKLSTLERGFSSLPYGVNPSPWSDLTNAANYTPVLGTTFLASPLTGFYSDFTQSSCESQGGIWRPNEALGPRCSFGYASYYNLVEDQDIFRGYAQLNAAVTENMNFHVDLNYAELKIPYHFASPSFPTTRGPQPTGGATFQYIVPRSNPYVAEFEARSGASGFPLLGLADGYMISLIRPFAHNGNPVLGRGKGFGTPSTVDNQFWRVSAGLDGTFGEAFGRASDVRYNFAATYSQAKNLYAGADYLGFRLQEALNGFGGPACAAADLDPSRPGTQNPGAAGQNGCQYFNPFSSSYAGQPVLGLPNPNYVPGFENSPELVEWLFDPREVETIVENLTIDLVFDGMSGIQIPGGEIGWAAGAQWRQVESREVVPSEFYNGAVQCPYPGTNNCPGALGQGPFAFYGLNPPDYYDQQGFSYFGEVGLPLLDNLNATAAVRREEFSGGLSATVYKVSGKWQIIEPLALRASYGTNFTAPPISLQPGSLERVVRSYTRAGGAWLGGSIFTQQDVKPEEGTSLNAGLIWQSRGFSNEHRLSVTLDYFDIETKGEIGELATHDQIANAVFAAGTNLANCSSPFINRVTFNVNPVNSPDGNCVQGLTTVAQLNNIQTDRGNGADQITAGIDFQVDYVMPVLDDGYLTFSVSGTKLTKLRTSAAFLDGEQVAPANERLGYLNFSSIGFPAPEWRLNTFLNYNRNRHNARLTARYFSSLEDERGTIIPVGLIPGTNTPFSDPVPGSKVDSSLTFDATYIFDLNEKLRLSATVANIFDKDPPYIRNEFGYDPRIGNPLGRTIEVGAKYRF